MNTRTYTRYAICFSLSLSFFLITSSFSIDSRRLVRDPLIIYFAPTQTHKHRSYETNWSTGLGTIRDKCGGWLTMRMTSVLVKPPCQTASSKTCNWRKKTFLFLNDFFTSRIRVCAIIIIICIRDCVCTCMDKHLSFNERNIMYDWKRKN